MIFPDERLCIFFFFSAFDLVAIETKGSDGSRADQIAVKPSTVCVTANMTSVAGGQPLKASGAGLHVWAILS